MIYWSYIKRKQTFLYIYIYMYVYIEQWKDSSGELFIRSRDGYFGVYFLSCQVKREIKTRITLVRAIRVTARFVTRFNLWLRHDLWPQNASICDPARFVTKSASICDQRYTMILEFKLCRGKLVFVFTLIMYATWYNMMHIYMNYAIILI